MKKRGFTLIELLAVIVVLAIIALIATPIVMNVIKNAQMGAAERSADNYVKAVEMLIATEKLDGNSIADGEYKIDANGNLTFGNVEVSGTKPNGGTIKIENGQVVKNESSIVVGDYTVVYKDGKTTIKELVKLLDVCNFLEEDAHNEGRNPNTVGAKYTCDLGGGARNFYVLETENQKASNSILKENEVTLILEGNYDTEIVGSWCTGCGYDDDDNLICESCGAGADAKLDEIASVWTKLQREQIGLPSAEQIVVADGQDEDAAYSIDTTLNNLWLYGWDNEVWGENIWGYWTSTDDPFDSGIHWSVSQSGYMSDDMVDSDYRTGIRPVITLSI